MFFLEITNELDMLGISKKLRGYCFLREGILYILRNGISVTVDEVYLFVSVCYGVRPETVEKAIRYSIEATWQKGNIININRVFGDTVQSEKGKPTNREFLFLIADRIKTKYA